MNEYGNDMQIDETALDVEWLQQPTLMFKYSKILAKNKMFLDKAKEELDILKAGIDRKIRLSPEDFGLSKLTETVINNTIIQEKEYIDLSNDVIDARYEVEMAGAAVRSLQDKKSALENLVKLHGQNYFAGPSVPRDLSKEWEETEKQKQVNKKVKMQRK